jgi:hypothetical protein
MIDWSTIHCFVDWHDLCAIMEVALVDHFADVLSNEQTGCALFWPASAADGAALVE